MTAGSSPPVNSAAPNILSMIRRWKKSERLEPESRPWHSGDMQFKSLKLFAVLGILGLAGCEASAPTPKLPEMTFRHLPAISLDVLNIKIVSKTNHGIEAPHIGHQFPTPPEKAMTRWAEDRLQSGGSSGTAIFTILEADATGKSLKIDTGVTGVFRKQLSDRYTVMVEARLDIFDSRGRSQAFATANATHTTTAREDISLHDRRQLWFELLEKLMAEFDKTMETQIRINLGAYLK